MIQSNILQRGNKKLLFALEHDQRLIIRFFAGQCALSRFGNNDPEGRSSSLKMNLFSHEFVFTLTGILIRHMLPTVLGVQNEISNFSFTLAP